MTPPRRIRRAARLLVIDEHERLLLFRFTFAGRLPFWATAGGECGGGRSFARRAFLRCSGLDRQRMNPLSRQVAERAVDHPLALEPRDSGKRGALDLHGKMRFAAAVVASVAVMAGGVVGHRERCGRKFRLEQAFDFISDRGFHIFPSNASMPMWKP